MRPSAEDMVFIRAPIGWSAGCPDSAHAPVAPGLADPSKGTHQRYASYLSDR